jgi:hypothetical protein
MENPKMNWRDEWIGMPEFVQDEKKPFSAINIRFRNQDDLNNFANLISQKLTPKTKSIWFPELEKRQRGFWVDDES